MRKGKEMKTIDYMMCYSLCNALASYKAEGRKDPYILDIEKEFHMNWMMLHKFHRFLPGIARIVK